jgi:phenylalanyl-tRNA synthetase beta chain
MPVIGIPVDMLTRRIKTPLDRPQLVEHLQHLGCDMEGFATLRRFRCRRCDNLMEITTTENPPVLCDRCGTDFKEHEELLAAAGEVDVIRMELLPVRPDMFDVGGLARVLRSYLGETDQAACYSLSPAQLRVVVDPATASEACPRPFIACAVVRNLSLDEDLIKVIMKLQENLHWAMGRDRKRASIGVYDLDTVTGPELSYRSVGTGELRFVPLGMDETMTPAEILTRHPKGVAYAKLLERFERYPLLADGNAQVMSMPPIINSEPTRVRMSTCNLFIDVTGTDDRLVSRALNVLVTSIAELDPSATLEQVRVVYSDREVVTPDLTAQQLDLDPAMVARILGIDLSPGEVERHLRQMGHEVDKARADGRLPVRIPAYRNDIMHPIDLVEDVAIAYGYHNVTPQLVPTMTVGSELAIEGFKEVARRAMIGQGFYEVITLTLSSPEADFDALRMPYREDCVVIDNPISVEQTIVRTTLVPGLLDTFAVNASFELPQLIFEVGSITLLDAESETGAREHTRVAGGLIGPKVDYAAVRSACEALLRELGWQLDAEPDGSGCFIPGRGARVLACRDDQRIAVGLMGELHPEVLERSKLVHPVSVFEVDLDLLVGL